MHSAKASAIVRRQVLIAGGKSYAMEQFAQALADTGASVIVVRKSGTFKVEPSAEAVNAVLTDIEDRYNVD